MDYNTEMDEISGIAEKEAIDYDYNGALDQIKTAYNKYVEASAHAVRVDREFGVREDAIKAETIEPEIKKKLDEIRQVTAAAFSQLTLMEATLNHNDLDRAWQTAKPNYTANTAVEFFKALKENYDRFSQFLNRYCEKGAESSPDVIKGLAQCYRNLTAMSSPAEMDRLFKKLVREQEVKDAMTAKLHAERDARGKEEAAVKAEKKEHADALVSDFEQHLAAYQGIIDAKTVFAESPTVNTGDFSDVSLVIGRAHLPSVRSENFPELHKALSLPDTVIEQVSLDATGADANILIQYRRDADDEDPEGLFGVAESLIVRFAQCYPAYFKAICAMHESTGSELISIMGEICYNKNYRLLYTGKTPTVESEQDGIRNAINSLSQKLAERMGMLAGESNIIAFNAANQNNAEDLILLVIKDYPDGFDENSQRKLLQLLRNANKYGIYLLLIEQENCNDTAKKLCSLCKNVYTYRDGTLIGQNGASIEPALGREHFNGNYFMDMFSAFETFRPIINLEDIFNNNYNEEEFSAGIEIPIGKEETSIVTLNLGTRGTNSAPHCVISGTTNSGKSSLLHDIVLGAALRYTPDELEFWVMDFKDGASFRNYERLNHVTMMALNNRARDTKELLEYLKEEMVRRNTLVSAYENIIGYNAHQRREGKPLLSRLIVVIDEYTQMGNLSDCIGNLNDIAQQGRSAGISLVMCSQIVDSTFDGTVSQANHRFEFTNNKLGRLIEVRDEAQTAKYLSSLVGNALYTSHGYNGTVHRMRVAFAGEPEKQIELMEEINRKYSAYKRKPLLIMGQLEVPVRPASELVVEETEIEKKMSTSNKTVGISINVPVGMTRLGKTVRYKIDTNNPLLFLFGDETRLANVEYSLLKRFNALSDKTNVYYVDTLRSADRKPNVMLNWMRKKDKDVRFARTLEEFKGVLDAVYDEYRERKDQLAAEEEVGDSIELVIHAADDLLEQLRGLNRSRDPRPSGDIDASQTSDDFNKEAIMDDMSMTGADVDNMMSKFFGAQSESEESDAAETGTDKKKQRNYLSIFKTLVKDGYNVRIYLMLQFGNMNRFRSRTTELFGDEPNLKDVIIIPNRPEDGTSSAAQIVSCLVAAKQDELAGLYSDKNAQVTAADLEYAFVIDEGKPVKILPYEWSF